MSQSSDDNVAELPQDVAELLAEYGITAGDEVSLRRALEKQTLSYNLFRLSPAAVRRWKCRYRLLLDAGYYDGSSVAEVYARALLAILPASQPVADS